MLPAWQEAVAQSDFIFSYYFNQLINIDKNILIQALDHLPLGIMVVDAHDPDWPVVYMNPVIGQVIGLDTGTLVGSSWSSLLVDPAELESQRERLLGSPGLIVRHLRQRWRSRSGEPVHMELQVSPLFQRPGQPAYWLVTVDAEAAGNEAASEDTLRMALRDAQLRLRQLDRSDPVTGLANRQAFLDVLRRDLAMASREERRVGLIVFQVDALDCYRDFYGKHAADSCLRKVAHAITGSLRRAGDFAARVADDRFAALVGSSDPDKVEEFARQIASRVRDLAIHNPRSPAGRYLTVSFSIGSDVPTRADADADLLHKAEAELDQVPGALQGKLQSG